jgi:hypothetical protein
MKPTSRPGSFEDIGKALDKRLAYTMRSDEKPREWHPALIALMICGGIALVTGLCGWASELVGRL